MNLPKNHIVRFFSISFFASFIAVFLILNSRFLIPQAYAAGWVWGPDPNDDTQFVVRSKDNPNDIKLRIDASGNLNANMAGGAADSGNLVPNGGFENVFSSSASAIPAGWYGRYFDTYCATCTFGVDSTIFRGGSRSLKLITPSSGGTASISSDAFPVEPGKTYQTFADYYCSNTANVSAYVVYFSGDTTQTNFTQSSGTQSVFMNNVSCNNTWQNSNSSISVPSTNVCLSAAALPVPCTRARVVLKTGTTNITAYFDNVKITSSASTTVNASNVSSGSFGSSTGGGNYAFPAQLNAIGSLCINGDCKTAWSQVSSGGTVTGTGTQNYITKWNNAGGTAIGNSLIFDNGTNVGIGTTGPAANLDMLGTGTEANPTTLKLSVPNSTTAGDAQILLESTYNGQIIFTGTDSRTDSRTANDLYIDQGQRINIRAKGNGSTYNTGIIVGTNLVSFSTNVVSSSPVERMRIDASGNVGIGTTGPANKLTVFDSGAPPIAWGGTSILGYLSYSGSDAVVRAVSNLRLGSGNTNDGIYLKSDGNVGIGTTAPGAKLDVVNTIYTSGLNVTGNTNINAYAPYTYDIGSLTVTAGGVANKRLNLGYDNAIDAAYMSSYDSSVGVKSLLLNPRGGNVGIGTTGPAQALDVVGQIKASSTVTAPTFSGNATTATALAANGTNCSAGYYPLGVDASGAVESCTAAGSGSVTGSGTQNYITKWNNAGGTAIGNSLVFDNGTNVGIGTTGPASGTILDANGVINAVTGYRIANAAASTNYLRGNGTNFVSSTIQVADVPTLNQSTTGSAGTLGYEDNRTISPSELAATKLKFGFTSYTNNNASPWADFLHLRSYIDSSGGLDNLLVFNKSTGLGMRLYQQTYESATAYATYKDIVLAENSPTANYIPKYSGTGNTVSIVNSQIFDNGTNVGIGTTGPATPLDVNGSIRISNVSDSNGNLRFAAANPYISASSYFIAPGGAYFNSGTVYTEATIQARGGVADDGGVLELNDDVNIGAGDLYVVNSSGNVGIGTTGPGYKLAVVGSLYASGSSKEYKENISNLIIDSHKIYDLRPVSFDYKTQYKELGKFLGSGHQFGLIAEEVAQVIPELAVRKEKDGPVANVDYEKLSILLLDQLQKQKKTIEDLEARIQNLEFTIQNQHE